jgi:2-polyprenyl-6-methoxyphenol hydroxylase-like FAD-dependent oxidoreductase
METIPILIAGGGPVGLTLAHELARRGVRCTLVERNHDTTRHPKMDITNGRSMELFRLAGLADKLRAAGVPQENVFDVAWVTSMTGHELHRFPYPSATSGRQAIRERNDGSQSAEPPMRASQIDIEPVLKRAAQLQPLLDARFGVEFEDLTQDGDGVTATVRDRDNNKTETLRCRYLVGCDGGTSRVREAIDLQQSGQARVMPRFMTHFLSDARHLLQRWGVTWHYQSNNGTLIAQDDRNTWTLQSRGPALEGQDVDPSTLLRNFAGQDFAHKILVANPWWPHLLVADAYGAGRVLLAGDAAHQYIPTGGYGMNTGIGDAFDLAWKLAAIVLGFGGEDLIRSYEIERRPVGLRNREGSKRHSEVRAEIGQVYASHGPALNAAGETGDAARAAAGAEIARIGNAENECFGLEFGYCYADSPIVSPEPATPVPSDPLRYEVTARPGARLPSVFLADGTALYDRLGPWFTLVSFGADARAFAQAAEGLGVPLTVLALDEPGLAPIYGARLLLVRPDQHVAWRGDAAPELGDAQDILAMAVGRRLV